MAEENIRTTLQFQADITDFKSAMQEANRSIKLANSEFKAASSSMDDWSGSTDGLSAKLNQLTAVHEAEKRKLDVLNAAYAETVAAQGENSAAAVELETKINNQQAAVNKVQKEIDSYIDKLEEMERTSKDTQKETEHLGDTVEETGDDAEKSAGGWTILKDVVADFVSDVISWAIDSFKELMTAGDNALATLSARTGATTDQMYQYRDVMDSIYRNNYGESFDDIADAMSVVLQIMGDMDNASLQNVTQKAIAMRDVYGFDFQETIRTVNSLMKQFGITSDEAFNLLVQGAQAGLNQNGDLLDTVSEYSVQFATAGYSADEMFNMLANGAQEGTWSVDKLGDAVKEFNIRAKDGTAAEALYNYADALGMTDGQVAQLVEDMKAGGETGRKAFETILAAVHNVEDPTMRYAAGVAIFGTTWEDLGESTVQALMKTEGGIDRTKAAMDNMADTNYDTLSNSLAGLGRVIQTDLLQPIANVLAPVAKALVEWLTENMPILAPIIAGVATAVATLAAALAIAPTIKAVAAAFTVLNGVLKANPIGLVVAAIAGLVAAFVTLWNNCEGFRNFFLNMWENIKNAFGAVVEWFSNAAASIAQFFSNAWEGIKNAWSGAKEWFGNVRQGINEKFEDIGNWFSKKFTQAKDLAQKAWSGVKDYFGKVKDGVTGAWSKFDSWMGSKFGDAWTAAKEKFASSTVGKYFGQIGDSIKGVFSAVKSALTGNFSDAWASIKGVFSGWGSFFSGLWDKAKAAFANAGSSMLSIGKNIVQGLWNGISNSIQWIKDKITGWVGNVMDFIKRLFGIHSPSTVMRDEVGKMLGLGMAEGIADSRNAVNGAVRKLGDAALDGLSPVGGGASASAAAGGRTIIFNQTNNSPRALSRREIYRQTNNALAFAGGV